VSATIEPAESFASRFTLKTFSDLDPKLQLALKETGAALTPDLQIKILEMPLFDGSVNESISPVVEFSRKDRLPYLLADKTDGFFIAAVPGPAAPSKDASPDCDNEVKLARVMAQHNRSNPNMTRNVVTHGRACGDKVVWDYEKRRKHH
jgi:hypothetical protein